MVAASSKEAVRFIRQTHLWVNVFGAHRAPLSTSTGRVGNGPVADKLRPAHMNRPMLRHTAAALLLFSVLLAGCRGCDSEVKKVNPSAGVAPPQLNFGDVKVFTTSTLPLTLRSLSKASLTVTGITIENGSAPGGASAFAVISQPEVVGGLEDVQVQITFVPAEAVAYEAVLQVATNDPENPTIPVLLSGVGELPNIVVTPACSVVDAGCVATSREIDFGSEAFARQVPVPATKLPTVAIVNEGKVELVVSSLEIGGADASAFTIVGNTVLPDVLPTGERVLLLENGEGVSVPIRFKPTSEQQQTYAAEFIVRSDDPDESEVRITLRGALRDNLAPTICANVTRVVSPDNLTTNYGAPSDWAPLLVPPPTGYDFTQSRAIEPRSTVSLSAFSSADPATCTTDPEDERTGLTYAWTVESAPTGAGTVGLGGAANPNATFLPFATGEYVLKLSVRDAQAHETSTTLKLLVARKEDLVAQLSWGSLDGGYAGVDLDIHLIRPFSSSGADPFSGAFSYFDESRPDASVPEKTSGDRNGFADTIRGQVSGANYDWGDPGQFDDPRLNLDNEGNLEPLLENVSLNFPENDPLCAAGPCRYKVMVHMFKDTRPTAPNPACLVSAGCSDGDQCNCSDPARRCVANEAPRGDAGVGAGQCVLSPQVNVKIFVRARATPAAEIPLPPELLTVPAPCHMVYVADVWWPQRGAPDGGTALDGGSEPVVIARSTAAAPLITRYGYRTQGSLACTPDTQIAGQAWYSQQPR